MNGASRARTATALGAVLTALLLLVLVLVPGSRAAQPRGITDITVTKTGVVNVVPGQQFSYQILVTNLGPSGALAVVATDTLPNEVAFVSASGPNCTHDGAATGGVVTCNIGALGPNNPVPITITVAVLPGVAGDFTNCVTAVNAEDPETGGAVEPDPDPNPNEACFTSRAPESRIGDRVWHDINRDGVQDAGEPGIDGVTVTLSGAAAGTKATGPGGPVDGFYIFNKLLAGVYTVVVTVPPGWVPTTPTSVTVDLGTGVDFLDADFGLARPIDLELAKSVTPADVGEVAPATPKPATFTISVTNKGPADATGVTVGDTLPAALVYQSDDSGGAFNPATNVWTIGSVAVNEVKTLTFQVLVTAAGSHTNVAEVVTANEPDVDSTPGNCTATGVAAEDDCDEATVVARTPVLAEGSIGDFVWLDIDGDGQQDAGEPGIPGVTLRLTNTGTSATAAQVTNSSGIYNFLQLPAGSYRVEVDMSTAPTRHALTTPGAFDVVLADGQEFLDADFGLVAIDLELTKTASPTRLVVGADTLRTTFTVTVTNKGPGNASGVVVDDVLDSRLTINTSSISGTGFNATTRKWTIGDLAVGASRTLSFAVSVPGTGGTYTNSAEVSAANQIDIDSTPANCQISGRALGNPEDDCDDASVVVVLPVTGFEGLELARFGALLLAGGAVVLLAGRALRRRAR